MERSKRGLSTWGTKRSSDLSRVGGEPKMFLLLELLCHLKHDSIPTYSRRWMDPSETKEPLVGQRPTLLEGSISSPHSKGDVCDDDLISC